ncbi:mitofusin-2 isoform X2 [Pocillopora verrucosa]
MSNLSSQSKRTEPLQDDGVDKEHLLHNFVEAKQKINAKFRDLEKYLEDCEKFLAEFRKADENERDIKKFSSKVSGHLAQVSRISEVLSRDQIKMAFFGRTSNGKSTTINAMLQDKILPTGLGHTTNCFLSVHGSDLPDPYILVPGSDDKRSVKSLDELADALSKEKLDPSSLVQVVWPKSRCKILSGDVVLVDSPGTDVSPDYDGWIDKHCLDADVFVLVANAESALMVTEKKFFHKVNQHLSKPNIFIVHNRWDASASEPDKMELVKNQHLSRSISFLVDELKCVDKGKAEDRVFFVSAKETLMTRVQKHQGMPQGGGAIHDEGFFARQLEFENFEHKLEECISKSVIQTKFEAHAFSGLKIVNTLKDFMEQRVDSASQQRSKLEKAKKEQENRLEYVKEQLRIYTSDTELQIKEITSKVQGQVTEAMREVIGQLGLLVNEFDHPFHPHPESLKSYKKELYYHLKRGLERNMTACCSNSQIQVIFEELEKIEDGLCSLLPETPEVSLEPGTLALDFQANFELDVPRLCTDFREDIEFHFSLGWQAILRNFLAPRYPGLAIALGANIQRNEQSLVLTAPAVVQRLASPTIPAGTMVLIVGGLLWKIVGWWFTALCGGVYVMERVCWTNCAKEEAFKRQFVDYASEKLQSEVSVMSVKCSGQVRQELTSTFTKLESLVQREMENLEENIIKLDKEITRLEKIENKSIILRNEASRLESELSQFITEFGLEKSKI